MWARAMSLVLSVCAWTLAFAAGVEDARFVQLRDEMQRHAARSAWTGVEHDYQQIITLDVAIPPDVQLLAAECAWNMGDTWRSYQRFLAVLQAVPDHDVAGGQLEFLRSHYGRVTVRRVEATPIALMADLMPFASDQRRSIEHAAEQLRQTGGFDGMLPAGGYRLGDVSFRVEPGLTPVVVQRTAGDGLHRP